MRAKIHRYCSWLFFIILFIYLFAIYQKAYLGVTLHQISWLVLVISGSHAWMTRNKHVQT